MRGGHSRAPVVPPRAVVRALFWLRRLLTRAANALVPAQVVLLERISGAAVSQLLAAVSRLGIPDLLAEGPRTSDELASVTKTHPESLARVLRALAAGGLFELDPVTGFYSNTRLAQGLRREALGSMNSFAQYFATDANLGAWAQLDKVLRTGESGFEGRHGVSPWEWLAAHPEEEKLFAEAMTALTEIDAPAIARAYPFERLTSICDVGAGRGALLAELLRAHGGLKAGLLEAPGVIALAREQLEAQGLAARVELHAGDLFESVPPGYGAYLLKDVLHDWDDARAQAILRAVRRAALPGARLLICEVLVEPLEASEPGAFIDLQMMVALSQGRQRSRAEFARLLSATGFRFERVWPTAFPIGIVEGVAI